MSTSLILYDCEGSIVDRISFAGLEEHDAAATILFPFISEFVTTDDLFVYALQLEEFLSRFTLSAPVFPKEELLVLTPFMTPEWISLITTAADTYLKDWIIFEETLDTIRGTVSDACESHEIPFECHRIQDVLGFFASEYEEIAYVAEDDSSLSLEEYEFIRQRATAIKMAAERGYMGTWKV